MNPYADAIDELTMLAEGLRRRSRYRRYSEGMRRAYGNRAAGIEKAIAVLRAMAADERIEGLDATPQV
mgnify:FL=1